MFACIANTPKCFSSDKTFHESFEMCKNVQTFISILYINGFVQNLFLFNY